MIHILILFKKQKHKRTIKKLHVQLAQVKQDSAISVIKAKEKIQTLENEIQIIKGQYYCATALLHKCKITVY